MRLFWPGACFIVGCVLIGGASLFTLSGCDDMEDFLPETGKYITPVYDQVQVVSTGDTVHFKLDDRTYNEIKCFNSFFSEGEELLSFFDKRSGSINIYSFNDQTLRKKILVQDLFAGQRLNNTTVYVKNFDSIYIANNFSLYRFDRNGACKDSVRFSKESFASRASLESIAPPIFQDGIVYAKARPYLKETSLKDLNKWKVIYRVDFPGRTSNLFHYLPKTYRENIYGMYFLDYGYCINDHGCFVFSFPADSAIYETDLRSFNLSYYAKSRFQMSSVRSLKEERKSNGDSLFINYLTSDSYGGISFDPFKRRYLRVAKSRLTMQDYWSKNWRKKQSLIIFDENKKIIGESMVDDSITLTSIFFSNAGNMYVRTNYKDEYAIHFVKLVYVEKQADHK